MTRVLLGLLALSWWGCSPQTGIQTGGEMGGDDDCVETRLLVAPDDSTPLGFSPSAVMALVATPFDAELRYRDVSSDGLVRTPASSSSTIHLDFALDESRTFFVDSVAKEGTGLPGLCSGYLTLGGTLTLRSDDGAFDELISTEFTTTRSDRLTSSLAIAANALQGSFSLAHVGADDRSKFTYSLRQTILSGAWFGSLFATYAQSANSVSAAKLPYADWGSGACEPGTVAVTQGDAVYSALMTQAMNIISSAAVPLALSDGTSTSATVTLPQAPLACRVIDSLLATEAEDTLLLEGPLEVRTADSRWLGTLSGHAVGRIAASALTSLRLFIDAPTLLEPEFLTYYGFSGVDFGIHDRASLQFGVEYAVTGASRATGGYFEIWAPNEGVCTDCAPGTAELLLKASVGGQ